MLQSYTPQFVSNLRVSGARTLEVEANSLNQLEENLERGLPYRIFTQMQILFNLTEAQLAQSLGLARATLRRRKESGTLEVIESHALYQLASLLERASEVIGSESQAVTWMLQPAYALNQRRPLDCATSSVWREEVINLLGRLEHGGYA